MPSGQEPFRRKTPLVSFEQKNIGIFIKQHLAPL
jgi:hypothetical protein